MCSSGRHAPWLVGGALTPSLGQGCPSTRASWARPAPAPHAGLPGPPWALPTAVRDILRHAVSQAPGGHDTGLAQRVQASLTSVQDYGPKRPGGLDTR